MLGKISANITLATNAPIIAVRRSDPWPLLIAALPSRSHSARTEVRTFWQKYIPRPRLVKRCTSLTAGSSSSRDAQAAIIGASAPEQPATTSSATGPANRAVQASGRLLFREYCVVLTVLAVDGRGRFSRTCRQWAGQLPRRPSAHKVIEPASRRDAPRSVGQSDDPSARGAGIAARPPSCADSWFRVSTTNP